MICLHADALCVQTTRFNQLNAERIKKEKAHEPTPKLINEQIKAGDIKLPWTNATN